MYRSLLPCVGFLFAVMGCGGEKQGSSPSEHVVGAAAANATETFILIHENPPQATREGLLTFVGRVLEDAQAGDVIHFVSTPTHMRIATTEIKGTTLRARSRDPGFALAVQKFRTLLDCATPTTDDTAGGQLDIPRIAGTVAQLRRTKHKLRVFAVGNPLYCPHSNHAWAMTGGAFPSDRSLQSKDCPFGPLERQRLDGEATIFFIAAGPNWGTSAQHRLHVSRFYALYFSEIQASFAGVFSDPMAAYSRALNTAAVRLELPPAKTPDVIGMICADQLQFRRELQLPAVEVPVCHDLMSTNTAAISPRMLPGPAVLDDYFRDLPHEKTAIALIWNNLDGGPQDIDLDLRLTDRTRPAEEISYTNMTTSWGKLFRDVQRVTPGTDVDQSQWEYLEIAHDRLPDLEAYINTYRGVGRVSCTIRVSWRGQVRNKTIEITDLRGDSAHDQATRATSPSWKRIDLTSLFAK